MNGKGLKVIIANDANFEEKAKNVANTIVKRSDILGVIGHQGIQNILADQSFSLDGVTGKIKFKPGTGDRQKQSLELIRVVPCNTHVFGFTFIPMKFSTPEDPGLNCSISD
ncbi:hypothetical protein ACP6PL_02095 [Dapis sp. BLCC M126]|uniref:hypothetical protein n=1 Tax=Dapis sp. BLCC M126 TaxID=3400189 RepID=UPI003CF5F247